MGTEKTRKQKIDWMKEMIKKTKDKEFLLRQFILAFSSTKHTATEIYNLVSDKRLLNMKLK